LKVRISEAVSTPLLMTTSVASGAGEKDNNKKWVDSVRT
jgi:hypothetical protein